MVNQTLSEEQKYWTPTPRTYRDIGNDVYDIKNKLEINKISAPSQLEWSPMLTNELMTEITLVRHAMDKYWMTRYKYKLDKTPSFKEFIEKTIQQFTPKYFRETAHTLEFMYKGTLIRILDYENTLSLEELKKLGSDRQSLNFFNSHRDFPTLINLLFNKKGIYLDKWAVNYVAKVNGVEEPFSLPDILGVKQAIMGMSDRTRVSLYGINDSRTFLEWIISSPLISKEDLHVETGEYTGPADYYNNSLFKLLVTTYLANPTRYTFNTTPSSDKEYSKRMTSIIKACDKKYGSTILESIETFGKNVTKNKIIELKYSLDKLQTMFKLTPVAAKAMDEKFRLTKSKTSDFDFFIMSSSEDTIKNSLISIFPEESVKAGLSQSVFFG